MIKSVIPVLNTGNQIMGLDSNLIQWFCILTGLNSISTDEDDLFFVFSIFGSIPYSVQTYDETNAEPGCVWDILVFVSKIK